jgi:hypothetical protein
LLTEANQHAQQVVTQLLTTTGFKAIAVHVQPASPNTCS